MVQEIQLVLEALVVPGMQNKPENTVKDPIMFYHEMLALRELQMSKKMCKARYFYPKEMPQSVRCSCMRPCLEKNAQRVKNHWLRLIKWPVQLHKALQTQRGLSAASCLSLPCFPSHAMKSRSFPIPAQARASGSYQLIQE